MTRAIPSAAVQSLAPDAAARRSRLLELINASWTTQAIATAVELRVVDLLDDGPHSAESLALLTDCHAPSLRRLLCALATLDIVRQDDDGRFALKPMGALLRTEARESLAGWALLCGGRGWRNWVHLANSVRTGDSANRRASGRNEFAHLDTDHAAAALFHSAMANLTQPVAAAVAATLDFSGVERIVDVGGGRGQLIATILAAHPAMRGVLFDMNHAITLVRPTLAAFGVVDRCALICGSFFDTVPAGADAYLLKSVLHDWDDEQCVRILQQCRRAMAEKPHARLWVIERIAPERFAATGRDQTIARSDLNMLVALGGRERTECEFRTLLEAAGLRTRGVVPLPSEYSVVQATLAS